MASQSVRLFFALWPDDDTRRRLDAIARRYRPEKTRPVVPTNLHATLVFIGQQPLEMVEPIIQAATGVSATAFDLQLQRLELWRRPQVLSLCSEVVPESLSQLHADLRQALDDLDVPTEGRKYRPHITLARKVRRYDGPAELPSPLNWRVDGFALVESFSAEAGVVYQPLHHWQL